MIIDILKHEKNGNTCKCFFLLYTKYCQVGYGVSYFFRRYSWKMKFKSIVFQKCLSFLGRWTTFIHLEFGGILLSKIMPDFCRPYAIPCRSVLDFGKNTAIYLKLIHSDKVMLILYLRVRNSTTYKNIREPTWPYCTHL